MKNLKPRKTKQSDEAPFSTFSLADIYDIDPETTATIPSLDNVIEAKDWVDFNEK